MKNNATFPPIQPGDSSTSAAEQFAREFFAACPRREKPWRMSIPVLLSRAREYAIRSNRSMPDEQEFLQAMWMVTDQHLRMSGRNKRQPSDIAGPSDEFVSEFVPWCVAQGIGWIVDWPRLIQLAGEFAIDAGRAPLSDMTFSKAMARQLYPELTRDLVSHEPEYLARYRNAPRPRVPTRLLPPPSLVAYVSERKSALSGSRNHETMIPSVDASLPQAVDRSSIETPALLNHGDTLLPPNTDSAVEGRTYKYVPQTGADIRSQRYPGRAEDHPLGVPEDTTPPIVITSPIVEDASTAAVLEAPSRATKETDPRPLDCVGQPRGSLSALSKFKNGFFRLLRGPRNGGAS